MGEPKNTHDGNLADSIAMLEQILEVMPQDADAMKALYSAYRKVGKKEEAFGYLNRLVDVFMGGADAELLPYIQRELPHFEEAFPAEVAAQVARLRMAAQAVTDSPKTERQRPSASFDSSDSSSRAHQKETDISEELALAWRLYEEQQLSQEEYSSVLHDLTEVSSKELDVPVSVLHVLNDRGFSQMNRIMNFLSTRSGVPCLSLSNFELSEDVACSLPLEISAHEGALPFAYFGNDLLVGVLNPFNHAVVEKVEAASGHRCHTYLVGPEDYDAALGRLRSQSAKG